MTHPLVRLRAFRPLVRLVGCAGLGCLTLTNPVWARASGDSDPSPSGAVSKSEVLKQWKKAQADYQEAVKQKDPAAALAASDQAVRWARQFPAADFRLLDTLFAAGQFRDMGTLDRTGEAGPAVFLARHLVHYGLQLEREGQLTNGVEWINWASSLAKPNLHPLSPLWSPILSAQGRVLRLSREDAKAERVLRQRVQLLERSDAGMGLRLAAALEDLADVLNATGSASEVAALRARARQLLDAETRRRKK